jgi:hypothetical protein
MKRQCLLSLAYLHHRDALSTSQFTGIREGKPGEQASPAKAPSKLKKGHVNTDTNNPVKAPSKLKKGHVNTDTNNPAKSSFKAKKGPRQQ